ncbi:class I SAM-dependent methyltransferase [Streptomyces sp. NPDC014006]|uniref:class I SAM-dependent methyltransferase n=1 Tax=Streptomyces sp. NPDC014006 TaxID=3364870 RepID=UPI003700B226
MSIRNDDVNWDGWPVEDYLTENYRQLHPCDAAVIAHHAAYYRTLPAGGLARTVEFGAGPNLYPLLLASAVSAGIDAVEAGAANVAYLRRQLATGPDDSWRPFHSLCRQLDPRIAASPPAALARVRVVHGDVRALPPGTYELASMHFVAEGASEAFDEFAAFCGHFVRCVVPGGHLVAAFMENLPTYRIGATSRWPGCPVDPERVTRVFAPLTEELDVTRIDADPTLPEYGDTGMVLLTGRTRSRPARGG